MGKDEIKNMELRGIGGDPMGRSVPPNQELSYLQDGALHTLALEGDQKCH